MAQALCQRCGERRNNWQVNEAEFHVREIQFWKVQLCELCAVQVEMILRAALASPPAVDAVDPVNRDTTDGPRATDSSSTPPIRQEQRG
jgi:hypothetical protein